MKGSVVKRGKGYTIIFRSEGQQKWISGFKTLREAEKELSCRITSVHERSYQEIEDIAFGELCKKWLLTKARLKPSTVAGYKGIIDRYLLSCFGEDQMISSIKNEDIKAFIADVSQKVGARTVKHSLVPLKAMFKHAVENSYLRRSPCVSLDKIGWQRKEMRFLNLAERDTLLQTIKDHSPEHYPFFLLLATTGVRRSEAFGLRWQDVEFSQGNSQGNIHIRQTVWKGQVGVPKTSKSARTIPIVTELSRELRELKVKQRPEEAKNNLVFPGPDGLPMNEDGALRRAFTACLTLAELPRIRIHDLRHSFASILIASGVSPKIVADLLGHRSVAFTMDTYCHTCEAEKREAITSLEFTAC